MKHQPLDDGPGYSLSIRKAIMFACVVPLITAVAVILINLSGLLNVEDFGLAETHLYGVGFSVILATTVPLLIAWRCPSCRAWLGSNVSPKSCNQCGARFR